jgi:SAM-dependent methyltransferase
MDPDKPTSLTDIQYWDRTWSDRAVPDPLDPDLSGLNGEVPRRWHEFFSQLFAQFGLARGDRLLEAGCGGSVFLPYFERRFGLAAEGIDNSPEGCGLSMAIARKAGTSNRVMLADVFAPPESVLGAYRVVFSMGLVEHFRPTTSIIGALANLLAPGGWLVTVIPNLQGLMGAVQRVLDPAVYRVHVVLSAAELAAAHSSSGLEVMQARYLMSVNLSALNFNGPGSRIPPRPGLRIASLLSKVVWAAERTGLALTPNSRISPYAVVVARRGSAQAR